MTKKFEYFDLQLHIGFAELYVQNLPHKFKKSYGDLKNRNFEKSHRTLLLVPGQIWDRIRDPEQILV